MLVEDVLTLAMKMLSLSDCLEALKCGETTNNEDIQRLIDCYNLSISEINEEYYPIKFVEEIVGEYGKFYYTDFSQTPIEIFECFVGDKKCEFVKNALYIEANADVIKVVYSYYPKKSVLGDECPYANSAISDRIIALAVAREFLLMSGQYKEAQIYDERFRRAISSVAVSKHYGSVKARGWF